MGFQLFPTFKSCCFCLSLRKGSLTIGYVSTVLCTFALAIISLSLYKVIIFVNEKKDDTTYTEHTPEELKKIAISLYITHAYLITVFIYNIIICIVLIVGVHKNNTKFMRDYFRAGLFLLLLALANVVVSTIFLHFVVTLMLLMWSVVIFYCLVIVRSCYLEIEEENKPPSFEMQNLYNPPRHPPNFYA
ncbi:unnamed protein product [Colias eurytheme]|nr:unnamed protein product [Colias eurytheme]